MHYWPNTVWWNTVLGSIRKNGKNSSNFSGALITKLDWSGPIWNAVHCALCQREAPHHPRLWTGPVCPAWPTLKQLEDVVPRGSDAKLVTDGRSPVTTPRSLATRMEFPHIMPWPRRTLHFVRNDANATQPRWRQGALDRKRVSLGLHVQRPAGFRQGPCKGGSSGWGSVTSEVGN